MPESITATVTAGTEVDLLAGELDLHEAPHAEVTRLRAVERPDHSVAVRDVTVLLDEAAASKLELADFYREVWEKEHL